MSRLHADELKVGTETVRRLLAAQFPRLANLPLSTVASNGTDNQMWRLGERLAVRLPRRPVAAATIQREWRWLPALAPHLPLAAPVPVALGEPAEGYPFRWSINAWIEGADAATQPPEPAAAVARMAALFSALRAIPTNDGPAPSDENFGRGAPLAVRDQQVREALHAARDLIDARACARLWERCLTAAPAEQASWIHGDIHPGNLIVRDGAIIGLIDFGCMAVGDPACDLQAAWTLLDKPSRALFRKRLGCADPEWLRGIGWALSVALIQLPYYRDTSAAIAGMALGAIRAVLVEA